MSDTTKGRANDPMRALLDPRAIAVVGASQRMSRGTRVIVNLRDGGFAGDIFAINPRYPDVLGYKCFPNVKDLPDHVDCLVVAVGAEASCEVLEEAQAHGIPAAVVMAAGFGEGGQLQSRAHRLRAIADKGMAICGPNCFGIINVRSRAVSFNGVAPKTMVEGPVAIVSQSGGLGNFAFSPLMRDRKLGFSHFISCGNQIGTTVEDYVDWLVDDPGVTVIACVVEALKNPQKLLRTAQRARAKRKSLVFFQIGTSLSGKVMIHSHTGALAGDTEILRAFLRRCGIVQADSYDQFVETIELLANVPFDDTLGDEVVLVSGSGGGAALAADSLDHAGVPLAAFDAATGERLRAILPEFASVTNPIDATGVLYDDPALLPALFDAMFQQPGRPMIAASVIAAPVERLRRIAGAIADAARTSGRTVVAFQPTPLGMLDEEIVRTLHAAQVPLLLGVENGMGALKHLRQRREFAARPVRERLVADGRAGGDAVPMPQDFLAARQALVAGGVPVIDAQLALSAPEAVAIVRRFARPVALKAEAPGLLHKSDLGCVKLNCMTESDVVAGYEEVVGNARKAGLAPTGVLVQPMVPGGVECFAGIIDDPLFGPAIVFGLGGIFVEIMRETVTEMAPFGNDDALRMIGGLKASRILAGARGRPPGDIAGLAECLANLSRFAVANAGRFRALDLNPIIVRPVGQGVVAVDIAIEPFMLDKTESKP